jgi:hypothetical protein
MKQIIKILFIIVIIWFVISWYSGKLVDYFVIPVLIAIVAGLFTNILQGILEQRNRLERINSKLGNYVGNYEVYHWRDLSTPDGCNYKVKVVLNRKTGILEITQSGNHPYDSFTANIKVDEGTLSYGEGIYMHPQKEKNPFGRIQIYLISDNIINVDKTYLDIKEDSIFIPGAEKWQWKKV